MIKNEKQFELILFSHIYRCQNKRADELSNFAITKDCIDEKMYYDKDDEDEPVVASVNLMVKISQKLDFKKEYRLADKLTYILRKKI